jgi:hypothetical protein
MTTVGTQVFVGPEGPAGPPSAGAVSVRDYGAVGDGVHGDLAAFHAALTAAGNGAVLIPPGIYNIEGGLSLNNHYATLLGSGGSHQTILRATTQGPNYALDLTGWKGMVFGNVGKTRIGGFIVEGDNQPDPTKEKGGIRAHQSNGVVFENIGVRHTGGPCIRTSAMWGSIFTGVVCGQPIGAEANDVPFMHFADWTNFCTFVNLGFRSVEPLPNNRCGTAVLKIQAGPQYTNNDNTFINTWFQNIYVPDNSSLISIEGHTMEFIGTVVQDSGGPATPVNSSVFRIVNGEANRIVGLIHGGYTTGKWRYGVIVEWSRNAIVGTVGFPNKDNVVIRPDVEYTYISLGGQRAGTTVTGQVVDESGKSTNVTVNAFGGRLAFTRGTYTVEVNGGLVMPSPNGTKYRLRPPDGGGTATWETT